MITIWFRSISAIRNGYMVSAPVPKLEIKALT